MIVKRKGSKRKLDEAYAAGVKIKCCYCDIKDECLRRNNKEHSESLGFITRCSLTPNRPKSVDKSKKRVRNKKRINKKKI